MNALTKDPVNGFLESKGSLASFSAADKLKVIGYAVEFVTKYKKVPTMTLLSRLIGVNLTTFETHLREDEAFSKAWREVLLSIDDLINEVGNENALKPNGFMDRMAWRRRYLPEYWNPERVVHVEHTVSLAESLESKTTNYIDVDPLPS